MKYPRHTWTFDAIKCYVSRFNCRDCPIFEVLKDRCKMKTTIMMLISEYGTPTREQCEKVRFDYEQLRKRQKEDIQED